MKKDIVLAGVGGQGILTIAILIVEAAIKQGLNFRQSEVHGMSQRGGAVESHVRIADGHISGDLVPSGCADLLISVEPLEALRQINSLAKDATVITNITEVKNIPDYPPTAKIMEQLKNSGRKILLIDAGAAGKEAGNPRSQNVALLGAALPYLGLKPELVKEAIGDMFARKGPAVVELNLKALELGAKHAKDMN